MKFLLNIITLILFVQSHVTFGQTSTVTDGVWNSPKNWTAGVPTTSSTAIVNNEMTLDVNLSPAGGSEYTINEEVIDPVGGTRYSVNQTNNSIFEINANTSIEGSWTIRNTSRLTIRDNDTLIIDGDFTSGQSINIVIEPLGVLLVRGNMELRNSSALAIDGKIKVEGDFESVNSAIISGAGNLEVEGEVTINNSSTVFGTNSDCSPGPCEYGSGVGLPVSLISFNAFALNSNNLKVEWSTATETNNQLFIVEYSTNGKEFINLSEVAGAGNSLKEINYSIISFLPELIENSIYLRLKQIDYDGKTTAFKPILVHLEKPLDQVSRKNADFEIYPNPLKGNRLKLQFSELAYGSHQLQLIRLDGKVVKEMSFSISENEVKNHIVILQDLELEKGLYLLKLNNEQEQLQQSLIVH